MRQYDNRRPGPTAKERGYNNDHRKLFRLPVLERDNWTCQLCGERATVADHFPLSRKELVGAGLDPNCPDYSQLVLSGSEIERLVAFARTDEPPRLGKIQRYPCPDPAIVERNWVE